MKQVLAFVMAGVLLFTGASALAELRTGDQIEVVNCKEYITLREEPSTSAASLAQLPLGVEARVLWDDGGDFIRVTYNGEYGYVLRKYTKRAYSYDGKAVTLTDKQRYNMNLFLSNFTEAGFAWGDYAFELDTSPERLLVDFAIDHIWFNQSDKLEWGEYDPPDGDNVRLSDKYIDSVVEKYFGRPPMDLSQTRMDYRGGYYYWQETGGHTKDGFACLNNVEAVGEHVYSVYFGIFGAGENWSNDVCNYSISQAGNMYNRSGNGHALVDVGEGGSLNDRSGWRLIRYTWDRVN